MARRSWRWLRVRIEGLLTAPTSHDGVGAPVYASRLQAAVYSPTQGAKAVEK